MYALLALIYPQHLMEGVAYGDVVMAIDKTAAYVFNDNPVHKRKAVNELNAMRLARGASLEKGVKELWKKVDEVEAMNIPVLGGVHNDELDRLRKEFLYNFLDGNPDFKEVLIDYEKYQYD